MDFGQMSFIKFGEIEEETEENDKIREPAPAGSGEREKMTRMN